MKFLAIFMTLFMLASGFDLCTDFDTCDSDETTLITDKQASPELCSPFCQCAQCPFSVLIPGPLTEMSALLPIAANFIYPAIGDPTRVDSAIWQPPKSS